MKKLYEGTLKKNNQIVNFYVRTLDIKDLTTILDVQQQVIEHLPNPAILSPLSKEEYTYILEGNGFMIGAFDQEQLIAFRALLVPPMDDADHLGKDIGLDDNELSKVIYQEISNVLPAYRGNKLQKLLANLIMQELDHSHIPYRYICCTVAPFNMPSLIDKFSQGMKIVALKEKYGGKLRYIFVKDIEEPNQQNWIEHISIPMDDINAQQEMLSKGLIGIKMENVEGKASIVYAKPAII